MLEKSEIREVVMLGRADLNTYGSEYITGTRLNSSKNILSYL